MPAPRLRRCALCGLGEAAEEGGGAQNDVHGDGGSDGLGALGPLLGLPPKERWRLVAEKVEGKDHKECASHYKLQQILEREAAEGKKDA